MSEKIYNVLNTIFIIIVLILFILTTINKDIFNIIPQIILLFSGISSVINGKFKYKKYSRVSFKEQFILGICVTILAIVYLTGTTISISQ